MGLGEELQASEKPWLRGKGSKAECDYGERAWLWGWFTQLEFASRLNSLSEGLSFFIKQILRRELLFGT